MAGRAGSRGGGVGYVYRDVASCEEKPVPHRHIKQPDGSYVCDGACPCAWRIGDHDVR